MNDSLKNFLFPSSWRVILSSLIIGVLAFVGSEFLIALIYFFANLLFRGTISTNAGFPLTQAITWPLIVVPVLGSLVLGFKARYIDERIRGHGIPEVIERFTHHDGVIPARLLFLRPLASAISIGTGGPYGAEGPIIGLGSAIGSVIGQWLRLNVSERRTLLCAGAAAGISAMFGTPIGGIFLVLELFLRHHSMQSLLPVALASLTAFGLRVFAHGHDPLVTIQKFSYLNIEQIFILILISALVGLAAALMIHLVEFLEHSYEKLPVHWMWWPTIGILPLAIVSIWFPRLLGPSYDMIFDLTVVSKLTEALAVLCLVKGLLWSIAVSSRTTGGTLAPLFVTGGGVGLLGFLFAHHYLNLPIEFGTLIAILSMGSFFGAIAAVPVSATFLILEMTGSLDLLPIGLLASVVATLVTKRFAEKSIMSTLYS